MNLKKLSIIACNATIKSMSGGIINECIEIRDNFEDDSDNDVLSILAIIMYVIMFIFSVVYFLIMTGLWIRVVYYALNTSLSEGLASLFAYQLYTVFKFGSFINFHNSK